MTSRMKRATRRSALSATARWLYVGAFVAASLLLTTACNRNATDRIPDIRNVILVTLDTVRADHLGCTATPAIPLRRSTGSRERV